ncbi:MAG: hypothetical protein HQK53_05650 [Oligoflexia bacterium]|nr:hypothetical protein [Oligoflexia bacterium]
MYPNNTALANLVKEFGDSVLVQFTTQFFASPLVSMLIYLAGVVMFLFTAWSIHQRRFSTYIFYFWLAWIAVLPVDGCPAIYQAINTLTTLLSNQVAKITHQIFNTGKSIPPGFVYNAIFKAAATRINDPDLQSNVNFILDNCIPEVQNRDGTPLTASDLFAVETRSERSGAESFTYRFNPNYLSAREFNITSASRSERINCLSLLENTIKGMRRMIREQDIIKMPETMYVGSNNGEASENRDTSWDSDGSMMGARVEKMAVNLAQANAIQAQALNKYFDLDLSTSGGNFANHGLSPLVAASKESIGTPYINPTRIVLSTMGLAKAVTRSLNVDGFYDNAQHLYEMNEKLRNLPYVVAFVQSLLKVMFPLVCVTLFFGTLRFLRFWVAAWMITLFTPWFFYLSRMFSNTIILNANKVGTHVATLSTSPSFLESGVDFSAASKMLEDTSRAMDVFLNCELGIWGSLALLIPAASFFAGGSKSTGILGRALQMAENVVMFKTGGALVKGVAAAAGAGAVVKGGAAAVNAFNSVRGGSGINANATTAKNIGASDFRNYLAGNSASASAPASSPSTTVQSIIFLLFYFSSVLASIGVTSNDAKAIGLGDLRGAKNITADAAGIIVGLGLNCANLVNLPQNVAYFVKEAGSIVAGVGRVISERTLVLAMKRDYPNICHVLTQQQINSYSEGSDKKVDEKTILSSGIKVTESTTTTRLKPSYYWPKYFIEVTEKGNDPHPTFGRNNLLYAANRKIAYALRKWIDVDGAVKLTAYVMGGKMVAENLLPNFKVGSQEWEQVMKVAVMSPLEQMRVRANQKTTMTSYEAAIWPIVLSDTMAAHFTVCGPGLVERGESPGGYSWPVKGVPMTCPVAMSSDSIAYWDTGMIDYLDPETVSAMIIGSNPLTCGMDVGAQNLSGIGANANGGNDAGLGDKEQIVNATSKLTDNLKKAIQNCSWPILGPAQAIAGKALALTSGAKWKQTKCTLWGALAPRMSTSVYNSDYSFANTALKFKLLAHELFGVPRGREERWSLAYPWEGKGASAGEKEGMEQIFSAITGPEGINKQLSEMGISSSSASATNGTATSRAEALLIPGSPLMINASYTSKYFKDRLISMSKEAAYLAALTGASIAAGRAADGWLDRESVRQQPSSEEMIRESDQELNKIEDVTAFVDREPIYQKITYCHKSQIRGLIAGDNNIDIAQSMNVGTPYRGPRFPFVRTSNPADCLSTHQYTGCLRVSKAICRDANKVLLIKFERQEIVGYRKVQNPVIKKYQTVCKGQPMVIHKSTRRLARFIRHTSDDEFIYPYSCEDVEVASGITDTRQRVERPRQIEQVTNDPALQNMIRLGAMAAPWVVSETIRAKYGEIQGKNYLPGDRRIYTIWEKIECTAKARRVDVDISGVNMSRNYLDEAGNISCKEAIKYEVYKYVQTKLLREICDLIGDKEGDPWKK